MFYWNRDLHALFQEPTPIPMKKRLSLLLLFTALMWQLQAQDSLYVSSPPAKDYITTITLENQGKFPLTGTIIEIRDSSLVMSPLVRSKGFLPAMLPLTEVYAFDIRKIRVHRPNRFVRGALNGALVGLVVGAFAGFADGSDPEGTWFAMTAGEKALGAGIGFGIIGGVVGAAVGPMLSVNFPIKGSLDTFRLKKPRLVRYQLDPPK